jgi:hypothetical protein
VRFWYARLNYERGGAGGIRTLGRILRFYNGLANHRLQPLGHSSIYLTDNHLHPKYETRLKNYAQILSTSLETHDRKTAERKLGEFVKKIEQKEAEIPDGLFQDFSGWRWSKES